MRLPPLAYYPPEGIEPRELFVALLDPAPTVTIPGLPGAGPLRVHALGARTLDRIGVITETEEQEAELLAAALGTTVEKIGRLYVPELHELAAQAHRALQRFPAYGYSDTARWAPVLAKGAQGTIEGHALGACSTDETGERPDRFWGVPLSKLLDCHWIAFRAARLNYKKTK